MEKQPIFPPIFRAETFDRALLWRYRAKRLRVVDGDTIVMLADVGFDTRCQVHVRLFGVEEPELGTPEGWHAKDRLERSCHAVELSSPDVDWPYRIQTIQRSTIVAETKTFTRYVGNVWAVVHGDPMGRLVLVQEIAP